MVSRPNGRSGEEKGQQEALGRRQGKRLRRFWRRGEERAVEEGKEDVDGGSDQQQVVQEAAVGQLLAVHTRRLGANQRGSNRSNQGIKPIRPPNTEPEKMACTWFGEVCCCCS